MKKKLFYVMAASLAFTACTDDDFGYENKFADESVISAEDLNLEFTQDESAASRATWVESADKKSLSFRWTAATDQMGLAFVGSATGTTGVTNYGFVVDSLKLESFKKVAGQNRWTGFYGLDEIYTDLAGVYTKADGTTAIAAEDLGSSKTAKFKTVNDYIMKGYYVAYYPFASSYTEAGTAIPVTSPARINASLDNVAKHTFAYSKPTVVNSGKQVTEFAMKPLGSVLRIELVNENATLNNKVIKSVALRTKGEDTFVTKATLNNPSAEPAASNITVAEDGKTSTLFVDYFVTGMTGENIPTLTAKVPAKPADAAEPAATDTLSVYFPILPTTFNGGGFEVILIDEEGKACVIDANFKNATTTLNAGVLATLKTKISAESKFDQAFVTTSAELQEALQNAVTSEGNTTITLLGDINDGSITVSNTAPAKGNVTINSSKGSKLSLESFNVTLHNKGNGVSGEEAIAADKDQSLTINAPLTITNANILGKVIVDDATIKGTVTVGKANAKVDCWAGQLIIKGDAVIKKDAKIISGWANAAGVEVAAGATLTVEKGGAYENGNFCFDTDLTKRDYYKSDLYINGTMTVAEGATFTDKGDTQVGATGILTINGDATNNNGLINNGGTINIAGTLTNEVGVAISASNEGGYTLAGNVDIKSGTLNLTGKLYNKATVGNLGTFTNSGIIYDYIGSNMTGYQFTGNGTYAAFVNSQSYLTTAVTRLNDFAADKYQQIILQAGTYDFSSIAADKAAKLNVVNEAGAEVSIKGAIYVNSNKTGVIALNSLTVQGVPAASEGASPTIGKVTILDDINFAGSTIGTTTVAPITIGAEGELVLNNNITVKAKGAIVNNGKYNALTAGAGALSADVYCTSVSGTGTWTMYPNIRTTVSF